jgi:hypothetical protein
MLMDRFYYRWISIFVAMSLHFSTAQSAEVKNSEIVKSASLDFRIVIPTTMGAVIKNSGGRVDNFGTNRSSISLEMSGNFRSVLIVAEVENSAQTHLPEKVNGVIEQRSANTSVKQSWSNYEMKGQIVTNNAIFSPICDRTNCHRRIQYAQRFNLIEEKAQGDGGRVMYTFVTP